MLSEMKTKNKCDLVVERLLAAIVSKQYVAGSQLPVENDLCKILGVSRITIRESLKKLEMMGVVTIQHGKGTFVKEVGLNTLMQPIYGLIDFNTFDVDTIYEARLYIEKGSCRLAARNRTEENIERLNLLVNQMKRSIEQENLDILLQQDRDFHIEIAEASKNNIIKATVINLEDISKACYKRLNKIYTFMDEAHTQHKNIFDAIVEQNEDKAEEAIVLHTIGSKDFLHI